MKYFKHFLRTILLVVFALIGIAVLLTVVIGLGITRNVYVILAIVAFYMIALVYYTATWHVYWAPTAIQKHRTTWTADDGTPMETVVENAVLNLDEYGSTAGCMRVSVNQCESGKCVKRLVIGDDVEFLGVFGDYIWFYIHSRFYAKRDGLVSLDRKTCQWAYHEPRKSVEIEEESRHRNGSGIVQVIRNGVSAKVNLRELSQNE